MIFVYVYIYNTIRTPWGFLTIIFYFVLVNVPKYSGITISSRGREEGRDGGILWHNKVRRKEKKICPGKAKIEKVSENKKRRKMEGDRELPRNILICALTATLEVNEY